MSHLDLYVLASYSTAVHPPRGICAIKLEREPSSLWGGTIVRPTGVGPEAGLPAALAKALSLAAEHPATVTAVVHVDPEAYDAIVEAAIDHPTACDDAVEAWRDVASLTAMLGDRCRMAGDLDPVRRTTLERLTEESLSRTGIPMRGPAGHY